MFGWFKSKSSSPPASSSSSGGKGPDFSEVDSLQKAEAMFRRGDLEKLFVRPLEFGGLDNPINTLYVPVGVVAAKAGIDSNIIGPLIAEGKITKYSANVDYQGNSFIPIAIEIVASDPGDFRVTLNIWGDALTRNA